MARKSLRQKNMEARRKKNQFGEDERIHVYGQSRTPSQESGVAEEFWIWVGLAIYFSSNQIRSSTNPHDQRQLFFGGNFF